MGYRIRKQGGGYIMASCDNEHATEANAAYIVKAANTAHQLADALEAVLSLVQSKTRENEDVKTLLSQVFAGTPDQIIMIGDFITARDEAAAVLAEWRK